MPYATHAIVGENGFDKPMIDIAELTSTGTIRLPAGIAARFRKADRFVVWTEDDIVHLKRITPRSVTGLVEHAPTDEPMPMEEVSSLVHHVRTRTRGK